jgi:DNA-binding NarL/FixJ family response regulator
MSRDSDAIRILTVDDHPLLRDGIAGLIADESDMLLAGEAANGRETIEQFRRLPSRCHVDGLADAGE